MLRVADAGDKRHHSTSSLSTGTDSAPSSESKSKKLKRHKSPCASEIEPEQLAKLRLKRTNIAAEIYVTEKNYVESLMTLVKVRARCGVRVQLVLPRVHSLTSPSRSHH